MNTRTIKQVLMMLICGITVSTNAMAMYAPSIGRFCSRDPIGFDGSPYHLYEVFGSQPLVNVDPTGEITSDAFVGGVLSLIDNFSPRGGVRQCFRTCTRVGGIGCVCVTLCFEATVQQCCVVDTACCPSFTARKICNVNRVEVDIGLFECTSLGGRGWAVPPFPAFQPAASPALKRPGSAIGGISGTSCPKEGHSGSVCITASAGFSTWTYGARGCYDFGSGNTTIDAGLGVGVGTGVSGGGAYTYTMCGPKMGCCN